MNIFTFIEITSVVFGILYLWLLVKENIWCWLFGILASALTIFLFVEYKLYLEAGLYFYYVIAGIYGWLFWAKHQSSEHKVPVLEWKLRLHFIAIAAGGLLSLLLGYLMDMHSDSPRPFIDAGITVFSFIATFMEARKVLSTWYYWFLLNGVGVWLQLDRGLNYYAFLSAFYTLMCIKGYMEWKKSYRTQQNKV